MMKFTRTKKLVFFNNKGGVGKTTIAYNAAVKFSEKGYKTALVDLDAQCNLSRLALGEGFENSLFSGDEQNIYGVLKGIVEGGSDIDLDILPIELHPNLSILPGSLKLSRYENLLITAYNQAAAGEAIGYFQTSSIHRYLSRIGLDLDIDIFVIDVSPNLGLLNRVILLGSDYFATPLMPDAFSLQGIENLGTTFEEWKKNWKNTGKALAGTIANEQVLNGEGLFVGYIMNSYNQYGQRPISAHKEWMSKIPDAIKTHLSNKHCRNGLVEKSWSSSLVDIKDYGELSADSHIHSKAIYNLEPGIDFKNVKGTIDNLESAKEQFETLFINLESILQEY